MTSILTQTQKQGSSQDLIHPQHALVENVDHTNSFLFDRGHVLIMIISSNRTLILKECEVGV
jgi:hypothetical protein